MSHCNIKIVEGLLLPFPCDALGRGKVKFATSKLWKNDLFISLALSPKGLCTTFDAHCSEIAQALRCFEHGHCLRPPLVIFFGLVPCTHVCFVFQIVPQFSMLPLHALRDMSTFFY